MLSSIICDLKERAPNMHASRQINQCDTCIKHYGFVCVCLRTMQRMQTNLDGRRRAHSDQGCLLLRLKTM